MTWGIPTPLFIQLHVALSLIGILTGLVALYGLMTGRFLAGWMAAFLATTVLTSVTGFPIPPFGFDPPRAVGVLSLALLGLAIAALYGFGLAGNWRRIFIGSAVAALYLNIFVGVTQAFQKLSPLQALAPTQSEPPFLIAQLVVLAAFIAFGAIALRRFRNAAEVRA
jgi:hypothetical protein